MRTHTAVVKPYIAVVKASAYCAAPSTLWGHIYSSSKAIHSSSKGLSALLSSVYSISETALLHTCKWDILVARVSFDIAVPTSHIDTHTPLVLVKAAVELLYMALLYYCFTTALLPPWSCARHGNRCTAIYGFATALLLLYYCFTTSLVLCSSRQASLKPNLFCAYLVVWGHIYSRL